MRDRTKAYSSRERARKLLALAVLLPACSQAATSDAEHEPAEELATTTQPLVLAGIKPVADTTLKSASPYTNFGGQTSLTVSGASGNVEASVLRFDQAQIAAAVGSNKVYSAKIQLSAASIPNGWNGAKVAAYRMLRAWTEGNGSLVNGQGATWACAVDTNNGNTTNDCTSANAWSMTVAPLAYQATPSSAVAVYASTAANTVLLDVTADVQAFLAGAANYGFMIRALGGAAGAPIAFDARQATNAPQLILDVGPDLCPVDSAKVTPGVCGCGVSELDTDQDGVPDCREPNLVPSADTVVRAADPNKNGGHEKQLKVTRASVFGLEYSLLQFSQAEITAAVPAGKQLFGAQIELTVDTDSGTWAGGEIDLHRMTMPWTEGNGADPVSGGSGATWYCGRDTNTTNTTKDCASADVWGVGSIFDGPTPYNATTPSAKAFYYSAATKKLVFDVTADVKAFLAGTANYGWVLRGKDDVFAADWLNVGSRESANPPRLVLTVSDPCSVLTGTSTLGSHLRDLECFSPSMPACTRKIVATVNADTQQAARLYFGQQIGTAEHLALMRDRQRKALQLSNNSLLAAAFCDGDDDGDMVGNANDNCKNTRPTVATDDSGCETTTLPAAPPRSFVDAILGASGVTYDARCVGAPVPLTPHVDARSQSQVLRGLGTASALETMLQFTYTHNQPAGCEWQFEVEVTLDRLTGGTTFLTSTFSNLEEESIAGSAARRWLAVPSGAQPGAPLVQLYFKKNRGGDEALWWDGQYKQAHFRVRVVNALGIASGWSTPQSTAGFLGNPSLSQ